ncbi:GNAT family N-acetyltransferase [Thalassospira lucentensis]|uniref:GNAT family N-acetyltransferase n=1 Tax=Thalassospira lucentensis TaxID=168935 RepID=UPI003D2F1C2C
MADKIRRLKSDEFPLAVEWAALEGWNPGKDDADVFFNTDTDGFWGAFDKQGMAAVISSVQYSSDFGFVGFYICREDRRGTGLGYKLWQTALENSVGKTIGLDGVIDQQDNYRKSGFKFVHRNIRFGGVVEASSPAPDDLFTLLIDDIAVVDAFEQTCNLFAESRIEFLRGWISNENHTAMALKGPMGLRGYGVIRPCKDGHKVGPLFAENKEDAQALFSTLLQSRKDQSGKVYLDVPEPNQPALDLVKHHQMTAEFETARMYKGPIPSLNLDMTFGISSFELG